MSAIGNLNCRSINLDDIRRDKDINRVFAARPNLTLVLDCKEVTNLNLGTDSFEFRVDQFTETAQKWFDKLPTDEGLKGLLEALKCKKIEDFIHLGMGDKQQRVQDAIKSLSNKSPKEEAINDDDMEKLIKFYFKATDKLGRFSPLDFYKSVRILPDQVKRLALIGDRVTEIGCRFLYGCTNLTEINLTPFTNLQTIGESFLFRYTGLKAIDLSPLTSLKTIGEYFLSECTSLKEIKIPSSKRNLIEHILPKGARFVEAAKNPNFPSSSAVH